MSDLDPPRTAPGTSGRPWQLHTRPTAVLLPRTALYRTHAHSPREPCGAEEKQLLLQRNMALRELAPRCRSSSGTAVAHISPALASERYTDESGVRRSLKIVASPQDHRGTTKDHIAPTYRPDVRTVALAEPEHELIAVRADERRSARRRLCVCGRRRAFRRPVTHRLSPRVPDRGCASSPEHVRTSPQALHRPGDGRAAPKTRVSSRAAQVVPGHWPRPQCEHPRIGQQSAPGDASYTIRAVLVQA